jgi:1-acyl-sn-glycerol-3-phosphate acyltransferase
MTTDTTDKSGKEPTQQPDQGQKPAKRPLQLTSENSARVRITRAIIRFFGDLIFFRTTFIPTIKGVEHFPRTGPTMMVFNHVTMLDPISAGAYIRFRDGIPIGKQELSRPPFGWLVWGWDTIPLRRGEIDMSALRRALMVLDSPDYLMIAPEGHRNRNGLRAPKEGFVLLATKKPNTLIVPCGVSGSEKWRANIRRLRRTPVTVSYGRPLKLRGKIARQQYAQVANEIMYQISALLAPELRGEYADLSKATMDLIEYA